jgi:hypothetical protein
MTYDSQFPESWNVGQSTVARTYETDESILADPRGLLHVWELPMQHAKYIMALDPTHGITGWSRASRVDEDKKTDNAAIVRFRVDALQHLKRDLDGKVVIDKYTKQPEFVWRDLQVAEWFAPVDAVEAARVAHALGRLYCGDAEEQCELIYESFPGPGVLTTQELLRVGYSNLWEWEYIADSVAESSGRLGWRSSAQTQQLLWSRARRHLMSGRAKILSPWLLAEYRDAVIDPQKMRAQAGYGSHDDLLQAASMAYWAGHKWSYDPDHAPAPVSDRPGVDWQLRAPILGDAPSYREEWEDLVDNWGGE